MSIQFGNSGYSFDVVGGLHKEKTDISTEGGLAGTLASIAGVEQKGIDPKDNRTRFALHQPDRTNENQAMAMGIGGALLVLVGIFAMSGFLAKALCILAGLGLLAAVAWWAYKSQCILFDQCLTTNEQGFLEVQDWDGAEDMAKSILGGWSLYQKPFVAYENKLRSIIVSAKTLPPDMSDATVSWECVDFDESHYEFLVEVEDVNGVVPFFQKNLTEFAAAFGDPDRKSFRKIGMNPENGRSQWQLILYDMPKDIHAGVAWS